YGVGFYSYYLTNTKVVNNTFSGEFGTGSTSYGMYLSYGNDIDFLNNTVYFKGGTSGSYLLYMLLSGYSNHNIQNNIFYTDGPMSVYYFSNGTNTKIDYNNAYTSAGTSFSTNTTTSSFNQWRSLTGHDRNSISHDTGLISLTDPRLDPINPASWSNTGRGVPNPGNDEDIVGIPSVTDKADGVQYLRAYEFTPNVLPPS